MGMGMLRRNWRECVCYQRVVYCSWNVLCACYCSCRSRQTILSVVKLCYKQNHLGVVLLRLCNCDRFTSVFASSLSPSPSAAAAALVNLGLPTIQTSSGLYGIHWHCLDNEDQPFKDSALSQSLQKRSMLPFQLARHSCLYGADNERDQVETVNQHHLIASPSPLHPCPI